MSEQSPWGQPPPPSTPAGGSYPPPPQGPPGGPPGPPGGWSPPSYGGPPSGPPPKQRNTAAIVAVVVGALVVIAAVVVTLVVTTGGDDAETAADGASTSAAPTGSATEATPTSTPETTDPTPEPTEEPSADPTDDLPADAIIGTGYAFELPGIGWEDALAEAQSSDFGTTLDAIIILGSSLDLAQSNILVEALTAGGASDLETLEQQWKRNLSGTDGAVPDDIPDITIDGERAIGVRFTDRLNVNGILIDQVAYLALHDGNQYSLALTLPSENDAVSEGDFEKVLDSWVWTS